MPKAPATPKPKPTVTRATKTADAKREAEASVATLLADIRASLYPTGKEPPTAADNPHETYHLSLTGAQALTLYSLLGQLRQANLPRRLSLEVQGLYDLLAALELPTLELLTAPSVPSTDTLADLLTPVDLEDLELADLC